MAACRAISETKSRSATVSLSLPACNECNSACRARCKQKSVGGAKQTPQTAQCVRELSPAAQAPSSPGASCTRRSRRSKSAAKPTLPVRDRKKPSTQPCSTQRGLTTYQHRVRQGTVTVSLSLRRDTSHVRGTASTRHGALAAVHCARACVCR